MSSLTLSSFGSPTCSRVRKKTNFDSDSDSEILGSILGDKVEKWGKNTNGNYFFIEIME